MVQRNHCPKQYIGETKPIPWHVSFRTYSNFNFQVFTVRDTKIIPAVKLSLELG